MRREAHGFPDRRWIRVGSKRSYRCRRADGLHESRGNACQEVGVAIVFCRNRVRARDKRRRLGIEGGDASGQVGVAKRRAAIKEGNVGGRRAVGRRRYRGYDGDDLTVRRWIGVGADRRSCACLIDAFRDGRGGARGEIGVAAILGAYGMSAERKIGKSQLRRPARQADRTERSAAIKESYVSSWRAAG